MIKSILVLANSTKHHPRSSVAGRELIDEGAGKTRWGCWIRPVSNHDEGVLDFVERRLAGAIDPKPPDVIQMPLSQHENNPLQPENWFIQPGQPGIKESALDALALLPLIEEPENLWLQSGQKIDRVNPAFLQKYRTFSLCILSARNLFSLRYARQLGREKQRSSYAGFSNTSNTITTSL